MFGRKKKLEKRTIERANSFLFENETIIFSCTLGGGTFTMTDRQRCIVLEFKALDENKLHFFHLSQIRSMAIVNRPGKMIGDGVELQVGSEDILLLCADKKINEQFIRDLQAHIHAATYPTPNAQ